MKRFALSFVVAAMLTGCAGYHLGPVKPGYLREIHSIAIPTFHNRTLIPRIEVLVTGTVIKQFQQDGTFRITTEGGADAVLKGEIIAATRSPARSVRGNVLSTTEFSFAVTVRYSLVDSAGAVLTSGDSRGETSYFVGSDIVTDERQALPLAAEQLATRLVSQLSEGW